jgi:hypothetical protein
MDNLILPPVKPLPPTIELPLPIIELPSFVPPVLPVQIETPLPTIAEEEEPPARPAAPVARPPAIVVPPLQIETPPPEQPTSEPDAAPQQTDRQAPESVETTSITILGTDIQVPVPRAEILSAAATTSVISVAATLAATGLFKRLMSLMKPIITQMWKQIQKKRGRPTLTWAREKRLHKARRKTTPP